jgi:hypothetical protein
VLHWHAHVLDEHIGGCDELEEGGVALGVLEVEPEVGAAKDYRDRSPRSDAKGDKESPEVTDPESDPVQDSD